MEPPLLSADLAQAMAGIASATQRIDLAVLVLAEFMCMVVTHANVASSKCGWPESVNNTAYQARHPPGSVFKGNTVATGGGQERANDHAQSVRLKSHVWLTSDPLSQGWLKPH